MIELAIAQHHAENVQRLSKIEERIIGIDGNGTGRIGALQRQDIKLAELAAAQAIMVGKIDEVLHNTKSWSKESVINAVKWMFGTILVILGLIITYVAYRDAHHPKDPIAQHASLSEPQTAGTE